MRVLSLTVPLGPALTVGAGVGAARFSPKDGGVQFDPFWKAVYEPVRLTFAPAAVFTDAPWAQAIQVKLNAVMFSGTFTSEQFGAIPGTFESKRELLWQPVIFVDVLRLVN